MALGPHSIATTHTHLVFDHSNQIDVALEYPGLDW